MSERQHPGHHPYDGLPDAVTELFGEDATAESAYDLLTVDVPATEWIAALRTARDGLGCTYFDWLSAVDEPGSGFRVCAHVAALGNGTVRRLMLRTTVPHDAAVLPSAVDVYAGAAWHERETHEMFGVTFEGHPGLAPLLLPEGFEGHPLRKDFVLAARVAKAWPGAKEPGESEHGGPKRRTMLPPGVPDPNEWGPLKGQLPPAAARPGRAARPAPTGDRPPRRNRSAGEGSAAQRPQGAAAEAPTGTGTPTEPQGAARPEAVQPPPAPAPTRPRRSRSASGGSASQRSEEGTTAGQPGPSTPSIPDTSEAAGTPSTPETAGTFSTPDESETPAPRPPRRSRSASDGSASQRSEQGPEAPAPRPPRRSRSASEGSAGQRVRSTDAPWHDAQPAFDDPPRPPEPSEGNPASEPSEPEEPTPASEQPEPGAPAPEPETPGPGPDKAGRASDSDTAHPAGGDTE
ncbi:NADH-quinone oxidoreductase subunit C [Streptomyces rhizosphaericola]|uniref:NADH-quinone oxidoreductase subunit C n=1 Tax=Streptomyces rhizosphaericola TaxID=2564098 RepID=UPI00367D5D10